MINEEKHIQSQNQGKLPQGMLLGISGRSYTGQKIFIKNGHVYGVTNTKRIIKLR